MNSDEIDAADQQFLIQLYEQTQGNPTAQVSMYEIGDQLGLERDATSSVAQKLIGSMLVEIKSLSGGIGISADGLQMARKLTEPTLPAGNELAVLEDSPLIDPTGRQAVEKIVSELKNQAGSLGQDFDTLSELMADLKTIDAQMESSRPKTAIIRECFLSIISVIKNAGDNKTADRIRTLVGKNSK